MAKCPFLKEECITEGCALWLKNPSAGAQRGDKSIQIDFDSNCSLFWSGVVAVQGLAKTRAGAELRK